MREKALILDEKAMMRAITRISYELLERNKGASNLCLIGLLTRGAEIANRMAKKILEVEGKTVEIGYLDITLFRDDIQTEASYMDQSKIDFPIADKNVILVDDVIYTGRSARAAIDAVMCLGRPQNIQLAVLIDRGHRELPIRADYVGKNLPTSKEEKVKVYMKERDGIDKAVIY